MTYSSHSLRQENKKKLITDWATNEGVFETPKGDFIVRLKVGKPKRFTTISRHANEKEAQAALKAAKNKESC